MNLKQRKMKCLSLKSEVLSSRLLKTGPNLSYLAFYSEEGTGRDKQFAE